MAQVQGPQANVQNRPIPIGPFNPEKRHSEIERWICIYPAYLNSKKTRQEGEEADNMGTTTLKNDGRKH